MSEHQCAVEGCERPSVSRGWCDKHYRRWKAHGDPEHLAKKGPTPQPVIDRLLAKVYETDDGCWVYTGTLQRNGYATIYLPKPVDGHARAHRVAYQFFIAEIPDDLEIDHLCNRRNCVNPWHMEPVDHAQNMRRGTDRLWDNRTECNRGHQITAEDIITVPGQRPGWIARKCRHCYHENNRKVAS